MRSLISTAAAPLAAAVVLVPTTLLGTGSTATAAPATHPASSARLHVCSHDEIYNGSTQREVRLTHTDFAVTHAARKRLPANTEFKRSVTMGTQKVLKATIKASASIETEVGAIFAKAKVKAGVEIGGEGSKTSSRSETEEFIVHAAKHPRLFVFYEGVDTFAFHYVVRKCDRSGQKDYSGPLSSFSKIDETGAVLCPHSRYREGTISYQVALTGGC